MPDGDNGFESKLYKFLLPSIIEQDQNTGNYGPITFWDEGVWDDADHLFEKVGRKPVIQHMFAAIESEEDQDLVALRGLGDLIDPNLCPAAQLPWMAESLGHRMPGNLSEDAQRNFVRGLVELNKTRGKYLSWVAFFRAIDRDVSVYPLYKKAVYEADGNYSRSRLVVSPIVDEYVGAAGGTEFFGTLARQPVAPFSVHLALDGYVDASLNLALPGNDARFRVIASSNNQFALSLTDAVSLTIADTGAVTGDDAVVSITGLKTTSYAVVVDVDLGATTFGTLRDKLAAALTPDTGVPLLSLEFIGAGDLTTIDTGVPLFIPGFPRPRHVADNGKGELFGADGETGTIDYETGEYRMSLSSAGVFPMTASYSWVEDSFPYQAARVDFEVSLIPISSLESTIVDDGFVQQILNQIEEVRPIHVLLRTTAFVLPLEDTIDPMAHDLCGCCPPSRMKDVRSDSLRYYFGDRGVTEVDDSTVIEHTIPLGNPTRDLLLGEELLSFNDILDLMTIEEIPAVGTTVTSYW